MKKGFVFIETITVVMILVGAMLSVYLSYSAITTDINRRSYYDRVGDLYKTDIIRSNINLDTLNNQSSTIITIDKTNCSLYMLSGCEYLLNDLKAEKVYINLDKISNVNVSTLNNSAKDYLKTIVSTNTSSTGEISEVYKRYIIVSYKVNNKYYVSSLDI